MDALTDSFSMTDGKCAFGPLKQHPVMVLLRLDLCPETLMSVLKKVTSLTLKIVDGSLHVLPTAAMDL